MLEEKLTDDFDAHISGGTRDDPNACLIVFCIQVLRLEFINLEQLLLGHLTDLVLVRSRRAARNVCGFFEKHRRRGRLEDKCETLVRINRNYYGKDHSILILGSGVEVLTKRHDVDALGTESWTHRRSRICSTGRKLEADITLNFLSHFKIELDRGR